MEREILTQSRKGAKKAAKKDLIAFASSLRLCVFA